MIRIEAEHLSIRYLVTPERRRRQRAAVLGIRMNRGMLGIALGAMLDLDATDAIAVLNAAPDDIESRPLNDITAWAAQVVGTAHGAPSQ